MKILLIPLMASEHIYKKYNERRPYSSIYGKTPEQDFMMKVFCFKEKATIFLLMSLSGK